MIAGSSALLGAKPLAWICAAFDALCQLSLVAMTALSEERTRVSVGLASGLAMPKLASDGPATVTTSVFAVAPPMMNPAIITSLPVSTWPRVERLASRGAFAERTKFAPTIFASSIVKLHGAFPAQAPPHPVKTEPAAGVAVIATGGREAKLAAQWEPQSMPAGVDVTVPPPSPNFKTVNP